MEKFYNVKIDSPNFMIVYGEKNYRSPVLFEKVDEIGLSFLKTAINAYSIPKYTITEWKPPELVGDELEVDDVEVVQYEQDADHEVVVEELFDEEPKSLLDKLVQESE